MQVSKVPTDECACKFMPITSANYLTWSDDRKALTRHAKDHCCAGFCEVCAKFVEKK